MTAMLRIPRLAALLAIATLILASAGVSFAESYRGLFLWAEHHGLGGTWAAIWPLQVDVFIAVGELALFVGLADRWPPRSRIAAWAVTGIGLVVSVAGNVGHVASQALTNRATASIPPLAAASALAVGLGVLKRVVAAYPVPSGTPEEASEVPAEAPEPGVPVPGEAPADKVPVPVDGYPVPPRGREAATAFASELRAGRVPGLRPIRTRLRVGQTRGQEIRDYLAALAASTP